MLTQEEKQDILQEFPNVNNFPYKIKISKPGDYYDYENFILSTTPLENHDPINKAYISEKIQMINVSTLVIKIVEYFITIHIIIIGSNISGYYLNLN